MPDYPQDIILQGKTILIGIGNTLRNDDGAGAILAGRLNGRVPFAVIDAGITPENYLGKIIRENPDRIILVDAADFGGAPGEITERKPKDFKTANFYTTHNSSLTLAVSYLQEHLQSEIRILLIQPKDISFGDKLSPVVEGAVQKLEEWFHAQAKG
jgi:hydrogenase 3 maturation protease